MAHCWSARRCTRLFGWSLALACVRHARIVKPVKQMHHEGVGSMGRVAVSRGCETVSDRCSERWVVFPLAQQRCTPWLHA